MKKKPLFLVEVLALLSLLFGCSGVPDTPDGRIVLGSVPKDRLVLGSVLKDSIVLSSVPEGGMALDSIPKDSRFLGSVPKGTYMGCAVVKTVAGNDLWYEGTRGGSLCILSVGLPGGIPGYNFIFLYGPEDIDKRLLEENTIVGVKMLKSGPCFGYVGETPFVFGCICTTMRDVELDWFADDAGEQENPKPASP